MCKCVISVISVMHKSLGLHFAEGALWIHVEPYFAIHNFNFSDNLAQQNELVLGWNIYRVLTYCLTWSKCHKISQNHFLFMAIFLSRVSYVCVLFFCKYLRPIYCSCFLWRYIYVTLFIFWYSINRMVKLYLHFRFCTVVGQGFFIYLQSYLAITKLALLETTWEFRHLVLNTCGYRLYHHHMTDDVLKMSSFFKTWPQFWIPPSNWSKCVF